MDDLIERLRAPIRAISLHPGGQRLEVTGDPRNPLCLEAAAELERLAKENAALRADAERLDYMGELDDDPVAFRAAIDSARAKESGDG